MYGFSDTGSIVECGRLGPRAARIDFLEVGRLGLMADDGLGVVPVVAVRADHEDQLRRIDEPREALAPA